MATDFDSDLPVRNDGLYDASNNPVPSHAGLDAATRGANNDLTLRTEQLTSIEDSAGNVRALDVSLHDESGEAFAGNNPLDVRVGDGSNQLGISSNNAAYVTLLNDDGTVRDGVQDIAHSLSVVQATNEVFDVNVISSNPTAPQLEHHETASTAPNGEVFWEFAPTVPANPLYLDSVWAAASGRMKIEVWYNDDSAVDVTAVRTGGTQVLTGFSSTANPNIQWNSSGNAVIPGSKSTYIIFKNLDNQSQSMYATIQGNQ